MLAKLLDIVASKKFFYCIVGLLIVQAAWIALSGGYPMAFDEDFHFGIIRLYSHHLLPFWSSQPPNADVFGAVYRDPSYLYHYLMSFPYRLIGLFTSDATVQVLVLRFVNIALFATALPLYRRLLLKSGASARTVHVVLALFVLVPIVPFLAAQINYDNLFIPLVALVLLLALSVQNSMRADGPLNVVRLTQLITIGLLACLVKYVFLPILLAVFVFLAVQAYRYLGKRHTFWRGLGLGVSQVGKRRRWLLVGLLVVSVGLFGERYAINAVRYHQLVPSCDKVLSVQRCKTYGPWNRDYNFALIKDDRHDNPLTYSTDWFYGVWFRTFFAVDGPASNFETRGPLVIPALGAIVLAGFGLVTFLIWSRRIFARYNRDVLGLFGLVLAIYVAVLWLDNYQAYTRTGQPVAISGRYLLAVYPLLMLMLALGYKAALGRRPRLQLAVAVVAVLAFMWGGGALTYILRSRDAWLWPNSGVQRANNDVRQWLAPVVPGSRKPVEFLPKS